MGGFGQKITLLTRLPLAYENHRSSLLLARVAFPVTRAGSEEGQLVSQARLPLGHKECLCIEGILTALKMRK